MQRHREETDRQNRLPGSRRMESENLSFLAWTWDDWSGGCSFLPALITYHTVTPTNYGAVYKAILQALPTGG